MHELYVRSIHLAEPPSSPDHWTEERNLVVKTSLDMHLLSRRIHFCCQNFQFELHFLKFNLAIRPQVPTNKL